MTLNPTAKLSLNAMPATIKQLMVVTRMSRGAVRNALKVLKDEKLIHVSAYQANRGLHTALYKSGDSPDAIRMDKDEADKARSRRYYLKSKMKRLIGGSKTRWVA